MRTVAQVIWGFLYPRPFRRMLVIGLSRDDKLAKIEIRKSRIEITLLQVHGARQPNYKPLINAVNAGLPLLLLTPHKGDQYESNLYGSLQVVDSIDIDDLYPPELPDNRLPGGM